MTERVIVNASPVIVLAHSNLLVVLQHAGRFIAAPQAVATELRQRPGDAAVHALDLPWIHVLDVPAPEPAIISWDLGPGESSVIMAIRSGLGQLAIIDDRKARKCASLLKVPVRGTVALILRAKQDGIISSARDALMQVQAAGLYLSDEVISSSLALIGE